MNCRSNPIRAYALLCTALLFAMLVFIAAPVMATTYYVNNDTGVDGNPGTIEAPWKTIDYGDSASLLSSGDTVIVEAGTYVPATANGVWLKNTFASAATPVTYKAQGLVVIDMTSVTGSTHGFTIVADGNVIDGDTVETPPTPSPNRFEIKGASVGVYVGPCYDVTVKNCTIHDGRCSASGDVSVMGLRVDGSTNTTATQNLIYNMHASGEVPWGPLGCGLVTGNATNLVFSNNTVDNVFIGVFYYANPTFALITTQNNIVVNCTGYGFVNPWCTDPSFFVCSNNLLFNDAITYGNFPAGNNAPYPDDVTADPMFRYRTGGDYRLLTGTPAKDAGFSGEFLGAYQGEWPALGIGTLSGKVTANVAGNPPVRGALVQTSDASVSTTTDANGNYSMVVPAASITLNVSAFGFSGASGTTSVPAGSTATLNFSLTLANAAKTYYVNGATGSDTNPGTLASPWKTINNGDVNNILNPGDTVIVSAGTYAQANANGVVIANRRGYSFAPITYKADGAVLIDQSGFVGDAYGFKVSAAGTVIDGFEVKGARVGVRIADGAHDSTVNGCKLHDGQSAGQDSAGVFVALADNVTVTRNVIYKFNDAGNAAWGPVGCGLETDGSVNLKVFNNTIDNCYLGVFYRPAGSITTKNNIVSNCTGWGFVNPWSTDASKFSNGYNLIFNNVVDYGNFPAGNNGPMGGDVSGQDPLFVNSAAGDYSLQNASPALNAGVDVGLPFIGPGPDMGALESSYIPPVHTYYVDNAAGDDTNPGTSALPWKTINNGDVKGILNPGDTVIVNAGTYPQAGAGGVVINKRRGTPIASITYKAQGVVKIDQSSFGSGSYGFQVSVRGITLDGFEIVGAQHGVLLGPGADNALVTNCKIHDYTALLDSTGVYAAQCTDASIIRNFIYNFNNPGHAAWGPTGCGVRNSGAQNLKVLNNTIDNCFLGVFFYPSPAGVFGTITTQNNIVVNITGWAFVNPWNTEPWRYVCSNNLLFNDVITYGNFPAGNNGPYPTDVVADPLFGANYTLQAASPAVDAGVYVGLPYLGDAPDIGAFESTVVTCKVSGKVTANVAGNPPVRGALVKAWGDTYSTLTDGNGNYSFKVDPGDIPLTVSAYGMSWPDGPVQTVTGTAGGAVTKSFSLDMASTATTYYVDNATGSDTNAGTEAQPWKTINNGDVKNILNPGDTVIVKGGTYAQADANGVVIANRHGYSFAPITYKTNGTVLIDQSSYSGDSYGFKVSVPGITIDGFEIKGSRVGVRLEAAASDCTVNGCKIHDLQAVNQDASGVFIGAADNVLLTRNVIYNVYDTSSIVWGPLGSGIRTSSTTRLKVFNNTIDTCYIGVFYYGSAVGGDIGPHGDLTLTNNIITNCPTTNDWGWAAVNPWHTAAGCVTGSNNFYYGNHWDIGLANGGVPFAGDIYGMDPLYVDRAAGNFALQSGSPAIDAGAFIGLDYQGMAPDIGAIEFPDSVVLVPVSSLADLGSLTTGTPVSLTVPLVVTVDPATFGDTSYYIEDVGRTSGVKVMGGIVTPGDRVTLNAIVVTDSNGEKLLAGARIITKTPGTVLGPLAMNNKALGGGPSTYQPGITGASGTNNIGLLVKVYGKVSSPSGNSFTLDDGSSVNVKVVLPAGATLPDADTYRIVVGISSCEKVGGDTVRVLKAIGLVQTP